mmetsp:Transcript_1501/g.2518  ORF Transcript_1501/g.2518 Transcript_1501/m.2518 type:complete len:579 (-) Transcript_1501:1724-3460(-)
MGVLSATVWLYIITLQLLLCRSFHVPLAGRHSPLLRHRNPTALTQSETGKDSVDVIDIQPEDNTNEWTMNDDQILQNQVVAVAFPALAACVVEPALTMIDMYFVGTQPSVIKATAGLAGLSVTGAVFNIIAAFTYPLCSGTTAVIARSQNVQISEAQKANIEETSLENKGVYKNQLGSVLVNGIVLAVFVGSAFAVLLKNGSHAILDRFFSLDSTVTGITAEYLTIRGFSLPFTLISYVVIGFCLAVQDVITPLVSIAASSTVNIIGDYFLVYKGDGGLVGAAIATSLATAVSAVVALQRLVVKYIPYNKKKTPMGNIKVWLSYIDIPAMKFFFDTSIALLIGMVANTLTYSAGARISSCVDSLVAAKAAATGAASVTSAGMLKYAAQTKTIHTAGHQIAMQLWWFLSYFSTPIALAAQAILPKDLTTGDFKRVDRGITKIMRFGVGCAAMCTSLIVLCLKILPGLFTQDVAVQATFQGVLPQVLLSMLCICLTTVIDGIYIGTNRVVDFITISLLATTSAWAYFILVAVRKGLGIVGTWNGMLIFCTVRMIYYILRFAGGSLYRYDKTIEELPNIEV